MLICPLERKAFGEGVIIGCGEMVDETMNWGSKFLRLDWDISLRRKRHGPSHLRRWCTKDGVVQLLGRRHCSHSWRCCCHTWRGWWDVDDWLTVAVWKCEVSQLYLLQYIWWTLKSVTPLQYWATLQVDWFALFVAWPVMFHHVCNFFGKVSASATEMVFFLWWVFRE